VPDVPEAGLAEELRDRVLGVVHRGELSLRGRRHVRAQPVADRDEPVRPQCLADTPKLGRRVAPEVQDMNRQNDVGGDGISRRGDVALDQRQAATSECVEVPPTGLPDHHGRAIDPPHVRLRECAQELLQADSRARAELHHTCGFASDGARDGGHDPTVEARVPARHASTHEPSHQAARLAELVR
jgi:hypothetical protein